MTALFAGLWGLIGASALVLGALMGLYLKVKTPVVSAIMAVGAGVLISAVAFGLMDSAYQHGGVFPAASGMLLGALVYFLADRRVSKAGGAERKRQAGVQPNAGVAIAIGSLLDDIPEALAIGTTLIGGGGVSWSMVAAVFLSNIPESLSSAVGMRRVGYSRRYILGLWTTTMLVCGVCAWGGFYIFDRYSGWHLAMTQAFAGGAILAMLASTMMPEAYEEGGPIVGLLTVLGFMLAFVIDRIGP